MTDMRVMLDLDEPSLRDMLAKRLYTIDPLVTSLTSAPIPWDDARALGARTASYAEADYAIAALRGLAADGLLVRG